MPINYWHNDKTQHAFNAPTANKNDFNLAYTLLKLCRYGHFIAKNKNLSRYIL